jgi:putative flippase GtrA
MESKQLTYLGLIYKALRFALVGFLGIAVDFSITWALSKLLGLNLYLSHSLGFLFAATSNFYLNLRWTFEDCNNDKNLPSKYLKFLFVAVIGLIISIAAIFILQKLNGVTFYASKLISIGIVFFWNFLVNNFFIFQPVRQ